MGGKIRVSRPERAACGGKLGAGAQPGDSAAALRRASAGGRPVGGGGVLADFRPLYGRGAVLDANGTGGGREAARNQAARGEFRPRARASNARRLAPAAFGLLGLQARDR